MTGKLKVRQVKSKIGGTASQRDTLRSLGLKRIGHEVIKDDRPEIRGMVNKVSHLVTAEVLSAAEAADSTAEVLSAAEAAKRPAKKVPAATKAAVKRPTKARSSAKAGDIAAEEAQ
jgi:large subunit ribosomal protein L30